MGKHRVFLAAPAGADRASFRTEVLAGLAPGVVAAVPGLSALSACLVDATPAVPPWQRPGEVPAPAEPAFDAVIDAWGESAALEEALGWLAPRVAGLPQASIRVAETVEKDQLARPAGARAPGVKFLALMCFHADLPPATARRLWTHHAPLALRVHVGMGRYVRDWVEAIAPDELPVPRFGGVAELHFPSAEVMAAQWFDSEAGRQAIIHDVGHFLERATRLYTTEHVLKA